MTSVKRAHAPQGDAALAVKGHRAGTAKHRTSICAAVSRMGEGKGSQVIAQQGLDAGRSSDRGLATGPACSKSWFSKPSRVPPARCESPSRDENPVMMPSFGAAGSAPASHRGDAPPPRAYHGQDYVAMDRRSPPERVRTSEGSYQPRRIGAGGDAKGRARRSRDVGGGH